MLMYRLAQSIVDVIVNIITVFCWFAECGCTLPSAYVSSCFLFFTAHAVSTRTRRGRGLKCMRKRLNAVNDSIEWYVTYVGDKVTKIDRA